MRVIAIAAGVLLIGLAALWASSKDAPGLLAYEDQGVIAQGAMLYEEHCAACHGANLEGQPNWRERDDAGYLPAPPHDETGHTWHHADKLLFEITKYGTEAMVGGGYRSNMQGFGDQLSDTEILAVLAYIKSTWPGRVIDTHNRINRSVEN